MKLIMESWRSYVNEEKIALDKPIALYHGTATMPDMRNISSFRQGAKGTASRSGLQGKGFFVFTDKQRTMDRLKSSLAMPSSFIVGYEPIDFEEHGYPMIVTVEVSEIDPELWSLDIEAEENSIVDILLKYIDEWRPLMGNPKIKGEKSSWRPPVDGIMGMSQAQKKGKQLLIPLHWQDPRTSEWQAKYLKFGGSPSPSRATRFNRVLKYIKMKAPNIINDQVFFGDALRKPSALKYIGEKPLPVKKLEVEINGKWIDVTTRDLPKNNPQDP